MQNPLIILYLQIMKTTLHLDEAVQRVFGNQLHKISHPSKEWNLFTCFKAENQDQPYLFKLLEVPATYYISQEIYEKKLQKLGKHLHRVKFFFVERSFQASYYILQAEQNLMTLQSSITLSKESGQIISKEAIYDFLDYANQLQKFPFSNEISFNSDQIGKTARNQFKIANYTLYFQNSENQSSLAHGISSTLFSMITLDSSSSKINIMEVYSVCQEKYDQNMLNLVEKFIESDYRSSQIQTLVSSYQDQQANLDNNTTLTESYLEDMDNISQVFANDELSCHDTSMNQSLRMIKKQKVQSKKQKYAILFIIFILFLTGIGVVMFRYLGNKQATECNESEYFDQNKLKCMGCSSSCEQCVNEGDNQCTSCKGNLFLLIPDEEHQIGSCQSNCVTGKIIRGRQCLSSVTLEHNLISQQ